MFLRRDGRQDAGHGELAALERRRRVELGEIGIAAEGGFQPRWPAADCGAAIMLHYPAESGKVESVALEAVIFGMLQGVGVHGEVQDSRVFGIRIFFCIDPGE